MTLIFSATDDSNNQGGAKINTKQRLLQKMDCRCLRQLSIYPKEFRSVERLYTIEFDRD
jgi:hypothetical protein